MRLKAIGLLVCLLGVNYSAEAMYERARSDGRPLVALDEESGEIQQSVPSLLEHLRELDEPEYERLCKCLPWKKHKEVIAIAQQLRTAATEQDLSFDQKTWLAAYVKKTSGCIPMGALRRWGQACTGGIALLTAVAARVVESSAHNCSAQKDDPETFCRTHQEISPCPYSCNEQRLNTQGAVAWGVAGCACALCVGFTLCSTCGDSPTLAQVSQQKNPCLLIMRYDSGIEGVPAVYSVLEKEQE